MNGNVTYNESQLLSGAINVNTTGNIQALNVQVTENGERTITPPEGVDGYAPITIDTNVPIPEPVLDSISITQNGTYTPPSGTDGYDEITVNVPQLAPVIDDITITENGTYTPPSGVDGYDEIIVNVSQEADIQPLTRTITTNGTTVINASDLNVDGFDPVTITTAVDGYTIKTLANTPLPIASFSDGTDNPLKSLTASIVPVQSGSGDPSPENVRPISGWAEEVITRTGKNLIPYVEFGILNQTDGSEENSTTNKRTGFIRVLPNTQNTISGLDGSGVSIRIFEYKKDKTYIRNYVSSNITNSVTIQTGADVGYIRFQGNETIFTSNVAQCEKGNQATTYEPYAGTTTTIPFTDSQGNPVEVYGGSVDVVNGGEQPRTLGSVDLGDLTWNYSGGMFSSVSLTSVIKRPSSNSEIVNGLCEIFKVNSYNGLSDMQFAVSTAGNLFVKCSDYTDSASFKTAITGYKLAYELATPTTFYTQPTSIKSLDGVNNVFASTGDVEELKYFANL